MQDSGRKLAAIRTIEEIKAIEGADKICAYRVGGWWVVDQINKYSVGMSVVYFEIDSWIPHTLAPFLSKCKEPRQYEGVDGERLRTIRLKGQISQGLLLSIEHCESILGCTPQFNEDGDITEWCGVIKWEAPIPACLSGHARGNFPSEIPKTDQERIQNLTKDFEELQKQKWVVTEKLDGTSCTFFLDKEGEFHVCSRNLDLKQNEENLYWRAAITLDIENKMRSLGLYGFAFQGEIIGEGIQGNQYKRKPVFHLFDVYDSNVGSYEEFIDMELLAESMNLTTVPIIDCLFLFENMGMQDLLKFAEGKSKLNDSEREGLVFQCIGNPNKSFKVISNTWLLKNE